MLLCFELFFGITSKFVGKMLRYKGISQSFEYRYIILGINYIIHTFE